MQEGHLQDVSSRVSIFSYWFDALQVRDNVPKGQEQAPQGS